KAAATRSPRNSRRALSCSSVGPEAECGRDCAEDPRVVYSSFERLCARPHGCEDHIFGRMYAPGRIERQVASDAHRTGHAVFLIRDVGISARAWDGGDERLVEIRLGTEAMVRIGSVEHRQPLRQVHPLRIAVVIGLVGWELRFTVD